MNMMKGGGLKIQNSLTSCSHEWGSWKKMEGPSEYKLYCFV